jgi:hypothetical protein
MSGDESFTRHGQRVDGSSVRGFWSWAYSDLLNNTRRGVLAEYIAGMALDCVSGTRVGACQAV